MMRKIFLVCHYHEVENASILVDESSSAITVQDKFLTLDFRSSEPLATAMYKAALDGLHLGLLICDSRWHVVHPTGQVRTLLGLEPGASLENLTLQQVLTRSAFDADSIALAATRIASFLDTIGLADAVVLQRLRQGSPVRMRLHTSGRDCWVASFEEMPGGEVAEVKSSEFVVRDSLTGLVARRSFEEAVDRALTERPENSVAVLLLDLDRFKAVNDTLGHAAGDAVLRLAAERLRASVRKTDMVARLGGDEFAILIQPCPTLHEPVGIAKRILDLVQRTYLIDGHLVNVGTSMGIARSPEQGSQCATLLKNADLALYHSKETGRGTYHFFDVAMERRAQARRTSELELRRALALRQLEVFYQPQVNTDTNRLVGFEALIRWRHPEKGLIPPADFLPIAEEIGVIVPIGDWVLRTACREAMNWPSDVTIAVNASPLQFDAGDYAEAVRRALASTGLPGERLEIEITEGILLRNDETVMKTLQTLQEMKVRIAMDDFGTGYASLSQLARFPFDKIKIDRSLAGFAGNDPKQRAIVRAITSLGQSLGVCTLAEGVEDAEQVKRLQLDGCHSVQGYFFGRPVPSSELAQIILQLHPDSDQQT